MCGLQYARTRVSDLDLAQLPRLLPQRPGSIFGRPSGPSPRRLPSGGGGSDVDVVAGGLLQQDKGAGAAPGAGGCGSGTKHLGNHPAWWLPGRRGGNSCSGGSSSTGQRDEEQGGGGGCSRSGSRVGSSLSSGSGSSGAPYSLLPGMSSSSSCSKVALAETATRSQTPPGAPGSCSSGCKGRGEASGGPADCGGRTGGTAALRVTCVAVTADATHCDCHGGGSACAASCVVTAPHEAEKQRHTEDGGDGPFGDDDGDDAYDRIPLLAEVFEAFPHTPVQVCVVL